MIFQTPFYHEKVIVELSSTFQAEVCAVWFPACTEEYFSDLLTATIRTFPPFLPCMGQEWRKVFRVFFHDILSPFPV